MKMKKISMVLLFFCLIGLSLSCVSAADFVVNDTTTHKDISSWLNKNTTVKGNNLLFNVSKYELTNTLDINKSVNIKTVNPSKKSQIVFNKNKNMFNINANEITFSGLILNHNGKGNNVTQISVINSNGSFNSININNCSIILNNSYSVGVAIELWKGNIANSEIYGKGIFNFAVVSNKWIGNIYKSAISLSGKNSSGILVISKWSGNISNTKIWLGKSGALGIFTSNWIGNLYKTNISSNYSAGGILVNKWIGKLSEANINLKGKYSSGFYSNSSTKCIIFNSTIYAKKGTAVLVSKNIKLISTKIASFGGTNTILIIGPRLGIGNIKGYKNGDYFVYYFKVYNFGEYKSKTSLLKLSYSKYKKILKIKPLNSGDYSTIKVKVPVKYSKYKNSVELTYLDGSNKEITTMPLSFKF